MPFKTYLKFFEAISQSHNRGFAHFTIKPRSWLLAANQLILPYLPFQKNETLETWHNWLLSIWSRLLNWKGPGTHPQSSKSFKIFQKNIALACIYQLTKFGGLMSCGSKDIFKNCTLSHILTLIMTFQI